MSTAPPFALQKMFHINKIHTECVSQKVQNRRSRREENAQGNAHKMFLADTYIFSALQGVKNMTVDIKRKQNTRKSI